MLIVVIVVIVVIAAFGKYILFGTVGTKLGELSVSSQSRDTMNNSTATTSYVPRQ